MPAQTTTPTTTTCSLLEKATRNPSGSIRNPSGIIRNPLITHQDPSGTHPGTFNNPLRTSETHQDQEPRAFFRPPISGYFLDPRFLVTFCTPFWSLFVPKIFWALFGPHIFGYFLYPYFWALFLYPIFYAVFGSQCAIQGILKHILNF